MSSTLAVLDFPPRLGYPNGFSGRAHRFLSSLSESSALHVLAIRPESSDWTRDDFLPSDLRPRKVWWADVPANPLNEVGPRGKLRRTRHYLLDETPYMSWPRSLPLLTSVIQDCSPDAVVLFLPYLSHLALAVPRDVRVIVVLEEGWERSLRWTTAHLAAPLRSWIRESEARRVGRLYRAISGRGVSAVVISESEKEWFSRWFAEDTTVIPHGVDCGHFAPTDIPETYDIGVFGNLSDGRVVDDALRLWRHLETAEGGSSLRWRFVGAHPPPSLQDLPSDRVTVTGFVPDLRPHYSQARVVVVPASFGTGVKTTVLEAWAMGRAVVASPHATVGLPVEDGRNVLIGDSISALARHTRLLVDSDQLRNDLGRNGLETVRRERDNRALATRFVEVVTSPDTAAS